MEISNVQSFLKYYSRVKSRTKRLFPHIPPDKVEWTYRAGKFTIGDLIRHVANAERYMYAETTRGLPSRYKGCGKAYAEGLEAVIAYYDQMESESVAILSGLSDEDLLAKSMTPAGIQITTWKWLRAMVEHEIHHRGQLYVYLGMLGVETPPIFGLKSEEVIEKSVE